jgi:hypothetical protein
MAEHGDPPPTTSNRKLAKLNKSAYVSWEIDLRNLPEEIRKRGFSGNFKGNKTVDPELVKTDLFRVALFLMWGIPLDDIEHWKEGRLRCMGQGECVVFKGPVCNVCRCCKNCASALDFAPNGKETNKACPGCGINPPRVRPARPRKTKAKKKGKARRVR